ncbi:MAG TPA: hypothetical protein VFW27_04975 [Actinoplanes sp.]|nr:hypothetical protein [Actinoplanes sp.]
MTTRRRGITFSSVARRLVHGRRPCTGEPPRMLQREHRTQHRLLGTHAHCEPSMSMSGMR